MGSDDLSPFCFVSGKFVYLGDCSIEDSHSITMVIHIENQVLAHDGQSNKADVASCVWHKYLLNRIRQIGISSKATWNPPARVDAYIQHGSQALESRPSGPRALCPWCMARF